MFSWIAGLGLVTKIALGAGVAVAATVGAGAAGVLPTAAQGTFDSIVSTVVPAAGEAPEGSLSTDTAEPTPEPSETAHPDNFGSWVSSRAHDAAKDGHTFGAETSEAAKQNGQSGAGEGSNEESTHQDGDDSTNEPELTQPDGKTDGKTDGKPGK